MYVFIWCQLKWLRWHVKWLHIWARWSAGIGQLWIMLIVLCAFVLYCVITVLVVMSRAEVIAFSTIVIFKSIHWGRPNSVPHASTAFIIDQMLLIQPVSALHCHWKTSISVWFILKNNGCICRETAWYAKTFIYFHFISDHWLINTFTTAAR